jgi:hypothetical protein
MVGLCSHTRRLFPIHVQDFTGRTSTFQNDHLMISASTNPVSATLYRNLVSRRESIRRGKASTIGLPTTPFPISIAMSTTASQNSPNAQHSAESLQNELRIHRCGISGNCRVVSTEDLPLYFVRSSALKSSVPDVTVFAGSDNTGAVVGVCQYVALSSNVIVGRGDPAEPNNVIWETLVKSSRDHSRYKVTIGHWTEPRQAYTWKRTHDTNLLGRKLLKLNQRSWKLIDDETESVVAVFAAHGVRSWRNTGEMRFLEYQGKEWEEWVLLTYFGIYEKAGRRALARRDLSWFW